MARGCQNCPTKVPSFKSHITNSLNPNSNAGFYSESTIFPGAVPVEKGEPEISAAAPFDGL
jgi:hypothetical protein